MKKLSLTIFALIFCMATWAQTDKKPAEIAETIYILPKAGMNVKFEAAVAEHNKKYHPEGPHYAALRKVDYGTKAGWYVWVMMGSYASLDSRAELAGHDEDWEKTVGPTVEEYGDTGLWEFDENLSTGMEQFRNSNKYNVWSVDLKPGQSERFKEIAGKLRDTYKSMGNRPFLVFNNQIHTPGGADVALLWSFDKYADLDKDWGTKEAFEKSNGEGSWKKLVDEWRDIIVDYDEEIRTIIK
jgi:hypothetical protein